MRQMQVEEGGAYPVVYRRNYPLRERKAIFASAVLFSMRNLLATLLLVGGCAAARAQEMSPAAYAAYDAALRSEGAILQQGLVQRKPNEADTAFLRRLFPTSFAGNPTTYAWRPSAYGPQLFFSHGQRDDAHRVGAGTELFVLDPIQPERYAVQVLWLEPIEGELTNLAAFFFADVDRDGQKELLALVYAEVQEVVMLDVGPGKKEEAVGRFSHWETQVFRFSGLSRVGRPRYQPDRTPRPYLNKLRSAAEVRRALAQYQQRPKPLPSKIAK
jgi:hypothetical protein